MAKIRVMSYLDTGAPQYPAAQRDAIMALLKVLNTTTYNTTYPTSIVVDANSKTLSISYPSSHGYTEGHLLTIASTANSAFQSDSYRVISTPSPTTLTCKIDNYGTVTYPTSETSNTMTTRHKPLDWEVVYSSASQYSIRSKDLTSTRNTLTIKDPSLARLKFNATAYSSAHCVAVNVSESVDPSTGNINNSYTSAHDSGGAEAFYWCSHMYTFAGTSYTPTAAAITANDHLLPWFLVGDERFFYLIVGNYTDTTNMRGKNPNRYQSFGIPTYRKVYAFGDPQFLGDPNFVDKGGTIFTAEYKPGGTNNSGYTTDASQPNFFTESVDANYLPSNFGGGAYFVRPLDLSGNSVIPVNLTTIQTPNASTLYNFATSNLYMQYPHVSTRGLIFFPYYTRVLTANSANTFNYLRSTLPWARFCPINITNMSQTWVQLDNTIIKSSNGKQIYSVLRYGADSTILGSYLYELD